ncbi:uncharacterized protein F4807DRAFT_392874 [Annulohypoxylon truncatum]|uniref:uncharacterized protein n=1 Tax=Annulohypoxylon truncatum TaxID=327061 RepID=UPI002007CD43|nr:uncharacterized protein F4807DRAFT_392874 [Annulohypoxylon truncatum]KAI1211532.1 hypothetical protein F4807DRAFT_392874 [Annulohypoxylon truncatum]
MATSPRQAPGHKISLNEFRSGYPQYAALLSSHPSFHNFRRFCRVRMRLLLAKQDEVAALESSLDRIDENENRALFLGCLRRDANQERQQALQQLMLTLAEYDKMLENSRRVLSMPDPPYREIQNLKNWVDGTACLSRHETEYLEIGHDLANLSGTEDSAITSMESVVEDCKFWLDHLIRKFAPNSTQMTTQSENILILNPQLQRLSRAVTIGFATITILAPTLVLPNISSMGGRMVMNVISTAILLSVISFFTRARTVEVFASGASYAAVLVAFTASNINTSGCCP